MTLKEIEDLVAERDLLYTLLIEARVKILELREGIEKALKWRNFDGDGISDPLRKELYKLIEEK
jgi:hypothetical protein